VVYRTADIGFHDIGYPGYDAGHLADAKIPIQVKGSHFGVLEQVVHIVVEPGQLLDLRLVFRIDRIQLFVDRLQLFVRALQLFVGSYEFLVAGLELFVGCFELLHRCLQIFLGELEFLFQFADLTEVLIVVESKRRDCRFLRPVLIDYVEADDEIAIPVRPDAPAFDAHPLGFEALQFDQIFQYRLFAVALQLPQERTDEKGHLGGQVVEEVLRKAARLEFHEGGNIVDDVDDVVRGVHDDAGRKEGGQNIVQEAFELKSVLKHDLGGKTRSGSIKCTPPLSRGSSLPGCALYPPL